MISSLWAYLMKPIFHYLHVDLHVAHKSMIITCSWYVPCNISSKMKKQKRLITCLFHNCKYIFPLHFLPRLDVIYLFIHIFYLFIFILLTETISSGYNVSCFISNELTPFFLSKNYLNFLMLK